MDRNSANDRLQHNASDIEPCIHLKLCAPTCHAHGDDGGYRRSGDDEREQAVTKLDGLVQCRSGAFHGDKGARLALGPGRAAESRAGHADNGPRHGNATLA